jgi:hypothetical protein
MACEGTIASEVLGLVVNKVPGEPHQKCPGTSIIQDILLRCACQLNLLLYISDAEQVLLQLPPQLHPEEQKVENFWLQIANMTPFHHAQVAQCQPQCVEALTATEVAHSGKTKPVSDTCV